MLKDQEAQHNEIATGVAAGLVFGLLGIVVATPLVVVTMVVVKMLYVEDVLGKQVSVPGR